MSDIHQVKLETGALEVRVRESAFPLSELCGFAARNNSKRGFLFVSKVLGKHWPARPTRMRAVHRHLAAHLDLGPQPWVFIAMAETATGLGQGVFEAVLEERPDAQALFLHSTRYRLPGRSLLEFQEPHCHAPDQYLYEPSAPDHLDLFQSAREVIVIDDEISTGTTLCNLVAAYRRRNPYLERVHFVSIANFSGAASAERFSRRIGLPVQGVAALHADYDFQPAMSPEAEPAPAAVGDNACSPEEIAEDLGRFGIDRQLHIRATDLDRLSADLRPNDRVLTLGTGEHMHTAFRVGLGLEERGFDVSVQATTRSPILVGADIERRLVFEDNYGEGIPNYLYNVTPRTYARTIVCHETPLKGLSALMQQLGSHCVTYRHGDHQDVCASQVAASSVRCQGESMRPDL